TVQSCKSKEKKKASDELDREKIYEPVEKLMEINFGNWICLNNSFLNGKSTTLEESGIDLQDIKIAYRIILSSPVNVIRAMMSAIERLLKRPGMPLRKITDIRFLLIILENPLLIQHNFPAETKYHHNLLKRIFGIISCLGNECHHALVNWFSSYPIKKFRLKMDLVHVFLSHRISKARRSRLSLPAAYESDWKIIIAANNQANKVSISEFYNTMADYIDLMGDFELWQSRSGKFAFCQYPFLISMGSKMKIVESDAKQQMETKWREAFFNMIFHQKISNPYLVLRVSRDNLIEDSLRQLAQNEVDLKKSLRIEFVGEDGVDAGGLRKEWFLLLVRSLFDPQYGMFTYDEDLNLCWFNPASFENEDQFFLVGIVLGLAIYNSTILDVHLPTACYKKLLNLPVGLHDLKSFRPSLAKGLEQLLTFEGDVEEVFCRSFVAELEVFGQRHCVPLIPHGDRIPVNQHNRKEFVSLYTDFLLNKSVERQFGAFKRGFYYVCGGNALSLFQPEEIELLVRGSDEPLAIDDIRGQTEYIGFDKHEETIVNFWNIMNNMKPAIQRKLLMFVTGSDRIPATGATQLRLKIVCGNNGDSDRLPSAHTCFNQLTLYKYHTKEKLEKMLLTAIQESQGFYFA
ncbi:putative E3 ubiquitin-protein ligase mug30, partial [Choanephora cucurbitarum]